MKIFGILTIMLLTFSALVIAAPVAEIIATPLTGDAPLVVSFVATENLNTTNTTTYSWDFGDESALGNGATVSHTYDDAGEYDVTLTVTDGNESDNATELITVTEPLVGSSFAVSTTTLNYGGESQERETTLTQQVTITNTGAATLTNVTLEEIGTWNTEYLLTVTPASVPSLASGESAVFDVSIFVPDWRDSGDFKIGSLNAVATATTSLTPVEVVLNLETISHLEITDIEYDIEDGGSDDLNTDGDSDDFSDDVTLGDEITIDVTFENTFDIDRDIEDIDILIVDEDRELDFDSDDDNVNRLRDGDDDTVSFTFTVDDDNDIDDGDIFSFKVEVRGDDEKGARHKDIFEVELEIVREDDEITIRDVRVIPSRVTCEDSIRLEVEIENTGLDDQDRAVVEFESDDLDQEDKDTNIDIRDGDDYTAKFTIDTRDLTPGTYSIDVFAGYKLGKTDDTDFVDFTVSSCRDDVVEEEEEAVAPILPPDFNDFPTGNVVYGDAGDGDSDANSPNYLIIGLLILAVIVVIILIIVLLMKATA